MDILPISKRAILKIITKFLISNWRNQINYKISSNHVLVALPERCHDFEGFFVPERHENFLAPYLLDISLHELLPLEQAVEVLKVSIDQAILNGWPQKVDDVKADFIEEEVGDCQIREKPALGFHMQLDKIF